MFQNKKFSIFLIAFFLLIAPFVSSAALVPCATDAVDRPCTLCDFIVGFHGLIKYGFTILTILAIVAIFGAGTMYVISTGDSGMMEKAKGFLKATLIGFTVVFCAWLIVSITMKALSAKNNLGVIPEGGSWNKFTCSTVSSYGSGAKDAPLSGLPGPGGSGAEKWKCVSGVCSQIPAGGTYTIGEYTSKAECEARSSCRKKCADHRQACREPMVLCCDTTQECRQSSNLSTLQKWCLKPGENPADLKQASCGVNNNGLCYTGVTLNQCPGDLKWEMFGLRCPENFWCCKKRN